MKSPPTAGTDIPPTLLSAGAMAFWVAVVLTGAGAGVGAVVLTALLEQVQHLVWPGRDLIDAATHADAWRHVVVLLGAGALTGVGQIILRHLTSGNGIDITEAISEFAGRLPALRTLGSAVLSILVVGMGASLGREGAPKQVGAVLANALSDRARLSNEQRRLLVACGAGAGMARIVYPLPRIGGPARRHPWACVVLGMAWSAAGSIRRPGRGRGVSCHDPRSDFSCRAGNGAYRPGSILRASSLAGRCHSHGRGPDLGPAFDL